MSYKSGATAELKLARPLVSRPYVETALAAINEIDHPLVIDPVSLTGS
jgi:hypothetical protein